MEYKETYLLNFFFGKVLDKPIKFQIKFHELRDAKNNIPEIIFEIYNNENLFPVEKEFREFNSINNKQKIGYNFAACVRTGSVKTNYNSFNSDDSYTYTEEVGMFLQCFVSYLLTFFQRRRVIIGLPKLNSGEKLVLVMPPFMAGEFVDSIGYGEPLILYKDTQECLNHAMDKYSQIQEEQRKRIRMLLVRYNETLNLPYSYERVEAYWRIMEALGKTTTLSASEQIEYDRFRNVLGMTKDSNNLKSFVKTLLDFNLDYTDDQVVNSFNFRNKTIHEYLSPDIMKEPYLSDIFKFLKSSVEKIILANLNIDLKYYREKGYSLIIENRVL